MKKLGFSNKAPMDISGELLVADFQSAVVNLVTMDVAQAEAERSEAGVTGALQYFSGVRSEGFLQPSDIAPASVESIARTSVDAHLKKVQAAQISSFTAVQVSQMQAEALQKYKGRKVRVARLGDNQDVFVPLWADNRTGQLREGTYNGKAVTGTIDDLALDKNVLVIKPALLAQAITPGRKYFLVRVIDVNTMTPNVTIDLV